MKFTHVEQYFDAQTDEVKERLETMRATILATVPDAEETISYNMPAVKHKGKVIVWYAGYKNHIGFYPRPAAIEAFADKLKKYNCSKGAIQFANDQPLPITLIKQMTSWVLKHQP